MATPETRWSVYMLRSRDGSLYTGIATDVSRRIAEHGSGAKGARCLRGRGPLKLVLQSEVGDRALATRAEIRIKRLSKCAKEELVASKHGLRALLAELRGPEEPAKA
jgi:putative endonuclease